MIVEIGGQRLGSGNKMNTELHNFSRSTHNLTETFTSSMACGTLVPFLVKPALNGDTFDIDLECMIRTIPTKGPLFQGFKVQMDIFKVPIRLYQGILHNNPINIGLKMSQVMLPTMELTAKPNNQLVTQKGFDNYQVSKNCLIKYLGISGIGTPPTGSAIQRDFNAVPMLAYFDIFKNYYANKQEANAYQICPKNNMSDLAVITKIEIYRLRTGKGQHRYYTFEKEINAGEETDIKKGDKIVISGYNLSPTNIIDTYENEELQSLEMNDSINIVTNTSHKIEFTVNSDYVDDNKEGYQRNNNTANDWDTELKSFPLENIDQMRKDLLSDQELGNAYRITNGNSYAPYKTIVEFNNSYVPNNTYAQNGLLVKTYQSDIFNNWLNTEWISGENGIAAVTSVQITDGKFTIDALNLAKKTYDMLNRIAITGGTYDDWQEAVYGEDSMRKAESPIYCGGAKSEVRFEEIVQTTETEEEPLGKLGGKGIGTKDKGGHMIIHVEEPSFIIGICSITPRVAYSQGNKFYMTDIFSVDDLHKPSLDGIGFQNLMIEQFAWWNTIQHTAGMPISRYSAGKIPAWLNYMTSVDEVYGDFADENAAAYMVLDRHYEHTSENIRDNGVKDITTYIDPSKYNYAFAYTELDAQNFWVQIGKKIIARRKMSAKIIPNL